MILFHSYRKRVLRRYGFSWRRAIVLSAVFILSYNVVTSLWPRGAATVAAASSASVEMLPLRRDHASFVTAPSNSLPRLAAADIRPAAEAVPAKPAVFPSAKVALADKIAADISNLLEPGRRTSTSARKVVVGKGDTLMELLVKKASVPREDAYGAVMALSKIYDPKDLSPGREVTVFFHADPDVADPKFSGVRIEKDIINAVAVRRGDDGGYVVDKEEKDVHRALKAFKGSIGSSLYVDARAQGVPDAIIFDLIKMYSWNVDFQRGIQPGDAFEVMYEEYRTDDNEVVPGRGEVVYAKLILSGDEMPFYRYEEKNGDVGYYDNDGRSAKKPLMKTPIDGARLSSGFGMRKHPVLGYSKMHKGVDFAAPRGTPIYAAGDGTIEKMGPYSSYGNYVRLRHGNGLKTAYAHMKSFKAGLKSGSRVKQGDVIGYVGSTGRSTGPHLHYEVMLAGRQVNPGSVKLPTGKALKGKDLKQFNAQVASVQQQFNGLGRGLAVAMAESNGK